MTLDVLDYRLFNSGSKQKEFARYYAEAREELRKQQAAQAAYNANSYNPWKREDGDVIDAEYTVVSEAPQIEDGSATPKEGQ